MVWPVDLLRFRVSLRVRALNSPSSANGLAHKLRRARGVLYWSKVTADTQQDRLNWAGVAAIRHLG